MRALPFVTTLLAAVAAKYHPKDTPSILNTSHPYWIVSTSTSRHPNKGLYLAGWEPFRNGLGRLRIWDFDYNNLDTKMAFWIWPVPEKNNHTFWLVGTKDSRWAGHMVWLETNGKSHVWPFHPDNPDPQTEWEFFPKTPKEVDDTTEAHGTSATHYYIASNENSRYRDSIITPSDHEMLYVEWTGDVVNTWALDENDDQALWKLMPVPCDLTDTVCEIPDWDAAAVHHATDTHLGWAIPLAVLCCCACFGCLGNATEGQRSRNSARGREFKRAASNSRMYRAMTASRKDMSAAAEQARANAEKESGSETVQGSVVQGAVQGPVVQGSV